MMKVIRRLLGSTVYMSGIFSGACIAAGVTYGINGGGLVLSFVLVACCIIGVLVGDWALCGGDICQRQMSGQ